jgi:phenylacetate-CoA oxygenase PaaJ subunit
VSAALLTQAGVLDALRDVEDPELPVSIVDLGLVVAVEIDASRVEVKVTFTAMGCPGMEMVIDDIRERLLREPGVEDVRVSVVWEPVWTKDRLTEDGRAALRECGVSV